MARSATLKSRTRTDGFNEMVNADHKGAKPDPVKIVAQMVAEFDGDNAEDLARDIIQWLAEGDPIE